MVYSYFEPSASLQTIDQSLFNDITILNNASLDDLYKKPPCAAPYVDATTALAAWVLTAYACSVLQLPVSLLHLARCSR